MGRKSPGQLKEVHAERTPQGLRGENPSLAESTHDGKGHQTLSTQGLVGFTLSIVMNYNGVMLPSKPP
jgi:hypothetical protein